MVVAGNTQEAQDTGTTWLLQATETVRTLGYTTAETAASRNRQTQRGSLRHAAKSHSDDYRIVFLCIAKPCMLLIIFGDGSRSEPMPCDLPLCCQVPASAASTVSGTLCASLPASQLPGTRSRNSPILSQASVMRSVR